MIVYGPNFRYLKPSEQPLFDPEAEARPSKAEAQRARNKARRVRISEEMAANPSHERHGTIYGYQCGCRCERCAGAMRAYHTARKAD